MKTCEIIKCVSLVTYLVKVDKNIKFKHANSIRKCLGSEHVVNEPASNAVPMSQNVPYSSSNIIPDMLPMPVKIDRPVISPLDLPSVQNNDCEVFNSPVSATNSSSSVVTPVQTKEPEVFLKPLCMGNMI